MSFGWKLLLASLIDTLERDIRGLVIGRVYMPSMLGFYNRGEQFPKLIVTNINGSIQSVLLPAMSLYQENVGRVKSMVRRSIMISSYIIFPMMLGLAFLGEPIIEILLTEKWLPAKIYLQIFCASYALWPIHTANLQAINALGRSDIFLKLEIVKKVIGLIIMLITIPMGVEAIAFGVLISSIISSFINAYPNKRLLKYGYFEQIKDIYPSLLITLSMLIPLRLVSSFQLDVFSLTIIQIITGLLYYISASYILKLESFRYLFEIIKQLIKRNDR
jgi:O-antigen/teichoic acid export membrane protein